jgi:hypothetical protein
MIEIIKLYKIEYYKNNQSSIASFVKLADIVDNIINIKKKQ